MADNDEKDPSSGSSDRPWWQEAMREVTMTGLATFFMTEDSIRSYLREKKFPKELVGLLLDGVTRRKEDFYGLLAKEFGRVLGKMDLSREVERFLEKHDVRVEAKVSFERKKKEVSVEVKHHPHEDKEKA